MRKVPAKVLVEAVNRLEQGFLPLPDGRSVFARGEYDRRLEAGEFAKVPVLVGRLEFRGLRKMRRETNGSSDRL